jgi:hypothetical protein
VGVNEQNVSERQERIARERMVVEECEERG